MKILTLGNGFIANSLPYEKITDRIYPSDKYINEIIGSYFPDILINCIGYCGSPNIDACELNKEKTFYSNTIIPIMLANFCNKRDIYFINIGSGCLFYSGSPHTVNKLLPYPIRIDTGWKEEDIPNPLSTYSKSKYACDMVLNCLPNTCTLRIRMPISSKVEPRNLLSKLISYNEIIETPNSMTFISELSRAISFAIVKGLTGTYHITSTKPIYHSQILNEYQKYIPEHKYQSITEEQLDKMTNAKRSNCILDNSKIINAGFKFEDQDLLLKQTVKEFASNLRK